jgi:hypothetical protein
MSHYFLGNKVIKFIHGKIKSKCFMVFSVLVMELNAYISTKNKYS